MRGENDGAVIGAFIEFFDKNSAFVTQPIDDEFIMDDLVTHKDWRAPFLQCHLDDLHRTINACAETARGGKVKHQCRFHGADSLVALRGSCAGLEGPVPRLELRCRRYGS